LAHRPHPALTHLNASLKTATHLTAQLKLTTLPFTHARHTTRPTAPLKVGLTHIAHAITIAVALLRVTHKRAEVLAVGYPISVNVGVTAITHAVIV
jgi:hypothetical protein